MKIPGFDIRRTIGKGGMATVYLADQESPARQVALKTLALAAPDDEAAGVSTVHDDELSCTQRFVNEGRIIAAIKHPNVVRIYAVGATEGVMYIAMEYLPGGDLQARMQRPLPVGEALDIVAGIGTALEHAHAKGIVHRDVKPANILFRDDRTPLLSDFGIAKDVTVDAQLTTTGSVLGSPFYLSPEQADGGALDGRADIYSLGVILFEMLTGKRPYDEQSAFKVVLQHLQAPVPALPGELQALQPLLDRMMAKDPERRFAGAGALVGCVRRLQREWAAGAPESPAAEPVPPLLRRRSVDAAIKEIVERFRNGILEDLASDRLILPSLPDVVLKVRSELEQPRADSERIAGVIAADPALSAQVLRVANSAFYGAAAPVRDLRRAVTRLGNSAVQQIVMMLVVAQLYDVASRRGIEPYLLAVWQHSTLVAALSEMLARRAPGLSRDVAMLAGLIHDIGCLPILVWAEQIPHLVRNAGSLHAIIDNLHAELGESILRRWRYPPELVSVAAEHERLERAHDGAPDYTDVVLVANVLARRAQDHPLGAVDLTRLPAAGRLAVTPPLAAELLEEARAGASALRGMLSP